MDNILQSPEIQDAINSRAVDHMDKGRLCGIAKDAVEEAIRRSHETGESPSDHELEDEAIRAVTQAGPCPPQCSRCEYHRSKTNPTPGKLIPGESGKCTRPTGLCSHINAQAAPQADTPLVPEIAPARDVELEGQAHDLEVQNTAAAIDQAVMDAEEVHKALGRIEGLEFARRVADVAAAQIFQSIKTSKSYSGLPYKDADGRVRHIASLEEFCEVKLGKSLRRVQELSQNLAALGPDLYEAAERIGFRNRDYRALKALPAEDQAVVKQALESETKDEVLDILQDLAAKHQAEREAAKKERDDLSADLEARGKLLEDKAARLETTEEELYKLKSLPKDADLELKLAREQEAVKDLNNALISALAEFNAMLLIVDTLVETDTVSTHTAAYATQTVQSFCQDVQTNLANYGIPVDFEDMVNPSWMQESAEADLEAGQTNTPNGRDW